MRWQVLLAYVCVHSVFALFLLGVSLLVPDSEVAKTQLVTLLLLDGLMTLSACQARKVAALYICYTRVSVRCHIIQCCVRIDHTNMNRHNMHANSTRRLKG